MSLFLASLDELTRQQMINEIDNDIANGKLYMSPRLSLAGQNDYPILLREAAEKHDDSWLAANLRQNGRLSATEPRRKPSGGTTMAKVPVTAPETLAEGEFNRFYIRGLCQRAIQEGIPQLIIYRAKQVSSPRADSEAKIGAKVDPQKLLDDLRIHQGIDTALGLPNGPNSGLSVKLGS